MIANIGHYSLIFLLIFLFFVLVMLPIHNRVYLFNKNNAIQINSVKMILITIAIISLLYEYVVTDFTIYNIKGNSHSALPLVFKIAGLWGNHEGSILLWSFLFIFTNFIFSICSNYISANILYKYLYIETIITFFFILFIIMTSNPFIYIYTYIYNGSELNPILQDTILAIHPPLIYIGYISSVVGYILILISLIELNMYKILKTYIRMSFYITWGFLTIGIVLGSVWAYYELGWGGWWFWDPVENAALMPWILVTIYIHIIKEDFLNYWSVFIGILINIFSLLGMFITRSGLLLSVHTFAIDLFRGYFLFSFLLLVIIASFYLFFRNVKKLLKYTYYTYNSIDFFIVMNFIVLLVIFIIVFLGTILPIFFSFLLKMNILIGISFYNYVLIPLLIPFFILMIFSLFYKRVLRLYTHYYYFSVGGFIFIFIFLLYYFLEGTYIFYLLLFLLTWLFFFLFLYVFVYRLVNFMIVSHFGVLVFFLGVLISNLWQVESVQIMFSGDFVLINHYYFYLKEVNYLKGNNYYSLYGNIVVYNDDDFINVLFPEKRYYFIKGIYMTKSVIHSNYFADIYAIIGDGNFNFGWYTKYFYRPLMLFVWIGPLFFILVAISYIYYYFYLKYKWIVCWL